MSKQANQVTNQTFANNRYMFAHYKDRLSFLARFDGQRVENPTLHVENEKQSKRKRPAQDKKKS